MTKKKERSELEYIRAENRRLKSEVRNLKKQLSRSNKQARRYADAVDITIVEESFEECAPPKKDREDGFQCPKCKSYSTATSTPGKRMLWSCDDCGARGSKATNG